MELKLEQHVYAAMDAAARRAAPLEACGLCGGREGCVLKFYELTNADAAREHYSMPPAEQFAAIKDMRRNGLQLLAIWHSHPETPARMSEEDLRRAYTPDVAYVIISLLTRPPALGAFTVADGVAGRVTVRICNNLDQEAQ